MGSVKESYVSEGHQVTEVDGDVTLTQVLHVVDLNPAAPEQQLLEALSTAGVPQLGFFYPGNTFIFCRQRTSTPYGVNGALVTCEFSSRKGPTWNQPPPTGDADDVKQISSGLVRERTTVDRLGAAMTLTPPPSASGAEDYVSQADITRPVGTIVFERTESAPPTARARNLVGKLNSLAIGAYARNELKFTRYRSQSDDGGRRWRTTYQFDFDPKLHRHRDTWKDWERKSPPDSVEQEFDVIEEGDFSVLGLDFSDSQTPV